MSPENTRVRAVDLDDNGWTGIVSLEMNGVRAVVESGAVRFWGWEEHTQVHPRFARVPAATAGCAPTRRR